MYRIESPLEKYEGAASYRREARAICNGGGGVSGKWDAAIKMAWCESAGSGRKRKQEGASTPLDLANMNSNVEFETQALAAAMPEQRKGHDDGETSWFQGLVGKRSAARGSLSIDLEMHHHQGRVLDGDCKPKASNVELETRALAAVIPAVQLTQRFVG